MIHEFSRTEMLIGEDGLEKLRNSTVAIFGIGGVGSFVAEGLARSGLGKFVIIDHDDIDITNINRQIHSNQLTIGKSKVEIMKNRIKNINPKAEVLAFQDLYNSSKADFLIKKDYDYVVDAIDMVSSKLDLIERCIKQGIRVISSMGAGNKLNPTMLEIDDIYNTSVCPLARVMRKELRNRGIDKLKVVYSKEKPITPKEIEEQSIIEDKKDYKQKDDFKIKKRRTPGSVAFVPSVAGLIIASEVVKDIVQIKD